jgi:hypothetical protein
VGYVSFFWDDKFKRRSIKRKMNLLIITAMTLNLIYF